MNEQPSHDHTSSLRISVPIPHGRGDRPCYETVSAVPVGAPTPTGRGIYRLLNTTFFAPFAIDDLVEVSRRNQHLEVVRLHQRGEYTTYYIAWDEAADAARLAAIQNEWRESGSWIETLCDHRLVVSVPPTLDSRPTEAELEMLESNEAVLDLFTHTHPDDQPEDDDLFGYLRARHTHNARNHRPKKPRRRR
jgi:hypothetical protein